MSENPDALELLYNLQQWGTRSNILVRLRGLGDRHETDLPISTQLQSVVRTAVVAIKEITRLRSELSDCRRKVDVIEGREPDPEIIRLQGFLDEANRRLFQIACIVNGDDENGIVRSK